MITGAGSGIGKAASIACASQGATVILLSRNVKNLEKVYDEIVALQENNQGVAEPIIQPLDLLKAGPDSYMEIADAIGNEFGRLDGLLHNAAILGRISPFVHQDLKEWHEVMQVNVNAAFMLTHALLPLMYKSDDASIIFTSSGVGRKGMAYWGAYGVSKFANEGMMQSLADELENSNIRVNSIDPGAVRTNMRATAFPGEDPHTVPRPEDIMTKYLFLLSADSKGVNGQQYNV